MAVVMIVVADDFTGAAEIAAAGFENGLCADVLRQSGLISDPEGDAQCQLCVFDTDSRLHSPQAARRTIDDLSPILDSVTAGELIFKKTDSILRGNVVAEIEAMLAATGRRRALLLPANPSSGRILVDRVYRIGNVPLDRTEFAHDPHHPARSADPLELLGSGERTAIRYCRLSDPIPETGIVVCEASTQQDVSEWARQIGPKDIPAGGRDFFVATIQSKLSSKTPTTRPPIELPGRALVIQGTRSRQAEALRATLAYHERDILEFAPLDLLAPPDAVARFLDRLGRDIAATINSGRLPILAARRDTTDDPDMPQRIQSAFAHLARHIWDRGQVEHFLIEGGATASSILDALDTQRLGVQQVWAPGVVTLAARDHSRTRLFTTKPGSYVWPDNLINVLRNSLRAHTFPTDS